MHGAGPQEFDKKQLVLFQGACPPLTPPCPSPSLDTSLRTLIQGRLGRYIFVTHRVAPPVPSRGLCGVHATYMACIFYVH